MRNRFDRQLEQLKEELIEMGSLIEQAIGYAVEAFEKQEEELADQAILFDAKVDEKEKEIESLCLRLLLQQQPVAGDLRLISAALKMITDMERIGDQAADISEITKYLTGVPYAIKLPHIPDMAAETINMVKGSIDAYVNSDLELAKQVIEEDDIVDELFVTVKRELIEFIQENTKYSEQAADLLMVSKYFERIGDHATNIAEWVIFSITGKH